MPLGTLTEAVIAVVVVVVAMIILETVTVRTDVHIRCLDAM